MDSRKYQHKLAVVPLLHQFAFRQIDLALEYITNPAHKTDLAIHETRRCLKRLRAIIRLVKAEVGKTIYDRDNQYLRNLGQKLSELRDATIVGQTLASLQKQFPQILSTSAWKTIKKDLVRAQHRPARKKVLAAIAPKLKIARSRVANWPLEFGEQIELRKALRKTYKKSQRTMKHTLAEPQAENFHEWRKQVNHLRHQLQILRTMKIGTVNKALKISQALVRTLGLQHDLTVLSQRLSKLHQSGQKTELHTLEKLIKSCQENYAAEAIKLGQRLSRKPLKAFIKSIPS